jgi:hypothetical protein
MRQLLDVQIGTDDNAPLTPRPVRHLDTLLVQVRLAGLAVDMCVEARNVPCRSAWTYPLTGSCRRRSPTRCGTPARPAARVLMRYGGDSVEVEVADDGATMGPDHEEGHGLIGVIGSSVRCGRFPFWRASRVTAGASPVRSRST